MSRRLPDLGAPAPEGEAPRPRVRGWRPYWASATTIAEQQRHWTGHMLRTPLSALAPQAAAAHIERLAADIRALGLEAAIERFVDALVPLPSPADQPEGR